MKIAINTSSFGVFNQEPLEMLKKVGLTIVQNQLGRVLNEDETINILAGCSGIIAGTEPITAKVMHASKDLRIISRCGVGLDSINLDAARKYNIKICTTPNAPSQATAEHTIALTLALLRHTHTHDADMKNNIWQKHGGFLIQGKNIGIIGLGRIGLKVANIFNAFGANIAYYDIDKKRHAPYKFLGLKELLAWSNIISLHCQATTRALLSHAELALMPQAAWLINTARGCLIDESALYNALKSKYLSGAALDVYNTEPYTGPLTMLDNIILSPHCASFTKETRVAMELEATVNLLNSLEIPCPSLA